METRVAVSHLKVREDLFIRFRLDEDAVQRYMELYQSGWEKAITVQAGTNVVIDGFHRLEACKRLGLKKILVEPVEVDDKDLRASAYKYNRPHGVPLTRKERNNLILKLYLEDGKTQQQIAKLMGLTRRRVGQILESEGISNANNDKRRELKPEDYPVIARLILGGEKQSVISSRPGEERS